MTLLSTSGAKLECFSALEGEMQLKIAKQAYTGEFKELAVKRVRAGQSIGAVAGKTGSD